VIEHPDLRALADHRAVSWPRSHIVLATTGSWLFVNGPSRLSESTICRIRCSPYFAVLREGGCPRVNFDAQRLSGRIILPSRRRMITVMIIAS
jgi:hypothetical protein